MALPKIEVPRYKHHLVGLDKTISYRGFTTKEQKILLQAKEEDTKEGMVSAIKQVVELCTFNEINIDTLPFFDIEDIFLRIRAKSVSNIVEMVYRVKDDNDEYTDEKINVKIDLDKIKVTCPKDHQKKILLTDKIGLMMKYPSLLMLDDEVDEYESIKNSIEYIFDEDEVYYIKDVSDEEVTEFIDNLDTTSLGKIKQFFDTMPRLRHEETITLKSGEKETIKFEGLQDFF